MWKGHSSSKSERYQRQFFFLQKEFRLDDIRGETLRKKIKNFAFDIFYILKLNN